MTKHTRTRALPIQIVPVSYFPLPDISYIHPLEQYFTRMLYQKAFSPMDSQDLDSLQQKLAPLSPTPTSITPQMQELAWYKATQFQKRFAEIENTTVSSRLSDHRTKAAAKLDLLTSNPNDIDRAYNAITQHAMLRHAESATGQKKSPWPKALMPYMQALIAENPSLTRYTGSIPIAKESAFSEQNTAWKRTNQTYTRVGAQPTERTTSNITMRPYPPLKSVSSAYSDAEQKLLQASNASLQGSIGAMGGQNPVYAGTRIPEILTAIQKGEIALPDLTRMARVVEDMQNKRITQEQGMTALDTFGKPSTRHLVSQSTTDFSKLQTRTSSFEAIRAAQDAINTTLKQIAQKANVDIKVVHDILGNPSDQQHHLMTTPTHTVSVLGGPGAGKTTYMGGRLVMLAQSGQAINQYTYTAPTHASAAALEEQMRKLNPLLPKSLDMSGVAVKTPYSIAMSGLNTHSVMSSTGEMVTPMQALGFGDMRPMGKVGTNKLGTLGDIEASVDSGQETYLKQLVEHYVGRDNVRSVNVSNLAKSINTTKNGRSLNDDYNARLKRGATLFEQKNFTDPSQDAFFFAYVMSQGMKGDYKAPGQTTRVYDLADSLIYATMAAHKKMIPKVSGLVGDEIQDLPPQAVSMFSAMTTPRSHVIVGGDPSQKAFSNDNDVHALTRQSFGHDDRPFEQVDLTNTFRLSPWNAALTASVGSSAVMDNRAKAPYMTSTRDPQEYGQFPQLQYNDRLQDLFHGEINHWFQTIGVSMKQVQENLHLDQPALSGASMRPEQFPFIFPMDPQRKLFAQSLHQHLNQHLGGTMGSQAYQQIYSSQTPSGPTGQMHVLTSNQARGRSFENVTSYIGSSGLWQPHEFQEQIYTMISRARHQNRLISAGENLANSTVHDLTPDYSPTGRRLPHDSMALIQRMISNGMSQQNLPKEAIPEEFASMADHPFVPSVLAALPQNSPMLQKLSQFVQTTMKHRLYQPSAGDVPYIAPTGSMDDDYEEGEEPNYGQVFALTQSGVAGDIDKKPDPGLIEHAQRMLQVIAARGPDMLKKFSSGGQYGKGVIGSDPLPDMADILNGSKTAAPYGSFNKEIHQPFLSHMEGGLPVYGPVPLRNNVPIAALQGTIDPMHLLNSTVIENAGSTMDHGTLKYHGDIQDTFEEKNRKFEQQVSSEAPNSPMDVRDLMGNARYPKFHQTHRAMASLLGKGGDPYGLIGQPLYTRNQKLHNRRGMKIFHDTNKVTQAHINQFVQGGDPDQLQSLMHTFLRDPKLAEQTRALAASYDVKPETPILPMNDIEKGVASLKHLMDMPAFQQHPAGAELIRSQFDSPKIQQFAQGALMHQGDLAPQMMYRKLMDQAEQAHGTGDHKQAAALEERAKQALAGSASFYDTKVADLVAHPPIAGMDMAIMGHASMQIAQGARYSPDDLHSIQNIGQSLLKGGTLTQPEHAAITEHLRNIAAYHDGGNVGDPLSAITMTEQMRRELHYDSPQEARHFETIVNGQPGDIDIQSIKGDVDKLAHLPSFANRMVGDQGERYGVTHAMSRISPFVTEMQAYNQRLQDPRGNGIVDPQAGTTYQTGQGEVFQHLGAGVPLSGYQRRLEDLLGRPGLDNTGRGISHASAGVAQMKQHHAEVTRLINTLGDPALQEQMGHYLNIVSRASTGLGAMDKEKTFAPLDKFFGPQRNQFGQNQRTLQGVGEYTSALTQGMEHLQRTGNIQRGHVDRLLSSMGHSNDHEMFKGLRSLEGQGKFTAPGDQLSLDELLYQFHPSQLANLSEEFTRAPLHPGEPVVFTGSPRGQQQEGTPEGTLGTLEAAPKISFQTLNSMKRKVTSDYPRYWKRLPFGSGSNYGTQSRKFYGMLSDKQRLLIQQYGKKHKQTLGGKDFGVATEPMFLFKQTSKHKVGKDFFTTHMPVLASQVLPAHIAARLQGEGRESALHPSSAVSHDVRAHQGIDPLAPRLIAATSTVAQAQMYRQGKRFYQEPEGFSVIKGENNPTMRYPVSIASGNRQRTPRLPGMAHPPAVRSLAQSLIRGSLPSRIPRLTRLPRDPGGALPSGADLQATPPTEDIMADIHKWNRQGNLSKGIFPPSNEQLGVLNDPAHNKLIEGGPGGGKTATIDRAIMDLIASGEVKPNQVKLISAQHSGTTALNQGFDPYRDMMPKTSHDYQFNPAQTFHSLAAEVALHQDEDGNYPTLQKLGLHHLTGKILEEPREDERENMTVGQWNDALTRAPSTHYRAYMAARGISNMSDKQVRSDLDDINEIKNKRGDTDSDYDQLLLQGRATLAGGSGIMTREAKLATYEQGMHDEGNIDYSDLPYIAHRALNELGTDALSPKLLNTRVIGIDEAQDTTTLNKNMFTSVVDTMRKAGVNPRIFAGMDTMQNLMQGLGGIDRNSVRGEYKNMLGVSDSHQLTRNFRSDAGSVALNNAMLQDPRLAGQDMSPMQIPNKASVGLPIDFRGLSKSQPTMYKKMFHSMLATAGIKLNNVATNVAQGNHALTGMDWPTGGAVPSPQQVPAIMSSRRQQRLFAGVAKREMQKAGMSKDDAYTAYKQMFRRNMPDHRTSPADEIASHTQFPVMRIGGSRSFEFPHPHVDVSRVEGWQNTDEKTTRSYLSNLFTANSRTAAGGQLHTFAASHPFTAPQQKYYEQNPDSLDESSEGPDAGIVNLSGMKGGGSVQQSPLNAFEDYQGPEDAKPYKVPSGYSGLMGRQQVQMDAWHKAAILPSKGIVDGSLSKAAPARTTPTGKKDAHVNAVNIQAAQVKIDMPGGGSVTVNRGNTPPAPTPSLPSSALTSLPAGTGATAGGTPLGTGVSSSAARGFSANASQLGLGIYTGGSKPPEPPAKPTSFQKFSNDESQFGHTIARIGQELQYLGQTGSSIVNKAIEQGSNYRLATVPISGGTGTHGFFDFSQSGKGINDYSHGTLPMYSNTQVAQGLQSLLGQTNTAFSASTLRPNTDIMGLSAMTGIDSSQLMGQMTGITGSVGGSSLGQIPQLTGALSGLYGNNLTDSNVSPTLSALQNILPTLQGVQAGGPSQVPQAMAFYKLALNAGMTANNLPGVSSLMGSLSGMGNAPSLQQQYSLGQIFGNQNLTASPDLAQFQSTQTSEAQNLSQMQLQQNIGGGLSLPNLQIQISQAQIKMDTAQFALSEGQQTMAQAQLGASQGQQQQSQLQQSYNVSSFGLQQSIANAQYGKIGQDTSKTAYFSWLRSQSAAAYNGTSPETMTQMTPAPTFGLQNAQFYAGMENQRSNLLLSRSPLLSDMQFQANNKYINQQEAFYQAQLKLTNEQRAFDLNWQPQLLSGNQKILDTNKGLLVLQGQQLVLQQNALGVQGEQLALQAKQASYEQQSDAITQRYLAAQVGDLGNLMAQQQQQLTGQGPVSGKNVSPGQILQALASQNLKDPALRQTINTMGLPQDQQQTMFLLVKQLEKGTSLSSIEKQLGSKGDAALLKNLQNLIGSGAFSGMQTGAATANASLNYGGTGVQWTTLIATLKLSNTAMENLGTWLAPTSTLVLSLATIANWAGPLAVGIGAVSNILGLLKVVGGGNVLAGIFKNVIGGALGSSGAGAGGAGAAAASGAGGVIAAIAIPAAIVIGGVLFTKWLGDQAQGYQDSVRKNPANAVDVPSWLDWARTGPSKAQTIKSFNTYEDTHGGQAPPSNDHGWGDTLLGHIAGFFGFGPDAGGKAAPPRVTPKPGPMLGPPVPPTPKPGPMLGPPVPPTPPALTKAQAGDWTKWWTDRAGDWNKWWGDRNKDWNAWWKQRATDWLNWWGQRNKDWNAWWAQRATDWNNWWIQRAKDWTNWWAQRATDWTNWWTQRSKDWNLWWQQRAADWLNFWNGIGKGIITTINSTWNGIGKFFTDGIGGFFAHTLPDFFTKVLPKQLTNVVTAFIKNEFGGNNKNSGGNPLSALFNLLGVSSGGGLGTSGPAVVSHGGFITPNVNKDFHAQMSYGVHQGVDFEASQGTPLEAFDGGTITGSGFYPWGGEIDVNIGGGLTERYLHLSLLGAQVGQKVKRGQRIGLTGGGTVASGLGHWSSGSHSHVQIDAGNINAGIDPWPLWALMGDENISQYYSGSYTAPGGNKGEGGRGHGGIRSSGAQRMQHLSEGGIAMRRMRTELAEQGPEAVVPLAKLASVLGSGGGGTGGQDRAPTHKSVTITKLADRFELHVHTTAQTMDDQAQDELMSQALSIFVKALNDANGKL